MNTPFWTPSAERVAGTRTTAFLHAIAERHGHRFTDYRALHEWSMRRGRRLLAVDVGLRRRSSATAAIASSNIPTGCPARGSFPTRAELRREPAAASRSGDLAIVFSGEGRPSSHADVGELHDAGRRVRAGAGAKPGSRRAIASPATYRTSPRRSSPRSAPPPSARSGRRARRTSACRACSIASARSSRGCSSRPMATRTRARRSTRSPRSQRSSAGCRRWSACVVVPYLGDTAADRRRHAIELERLRAPPRPPIAFEPLPFNHPLYIMYSSGTTGVPEVHRARRRRHAASST